MVNVVGLNPIIITYLAMVKLTAIVITTELYSNCYYSSPQLFAIQVERTWYNYESCLKLWFSHDQVRIISCVFSM